MKKVKIFLSIDIGNSQTNFGIFEDELLFASFHSNTDKLNNKRVLKKFISESLELFRIKTNEVRGVGISSVVPEADETYKTVLTELFKCQPLFINSKLSLPFKIRTDNPEQVGADRLCNVMAGYTKFGGPLIVVDFGTATNYDIISAEGDFIGGIIAPGIAISANALSEAAAKLPNVELCFPETVIGTNTVDNMQIGIMYSALYAMEGLVRAIKSKTGKSTKVIATGGLARLIHAKTKTIDAVENDLVLSGVKKLYDYQKSGRKRN